MLFARKSPNNHADNSQQDRASQRNPLAFLNPTVVSRAKSLRGIGTEYVHQPFARTSTMTPAVRSSLFQTVNVPPILTGRFFDRSHDKVQTAGITEITSSAPFVRSATFKGFLPPIQQGSVRGGSVMNAQPMFTGVTVYPRATVRSPVYTLTGRGN